MPIKATLDTSGVIPGYRWNNPPHGFFPIIRETGRPAPSVAKAMGFPQCRTGNKPCGRTCVSTTRTCRAGEKVFQNYDRRSKSKTSKSPRTKPNCNPLKSFPCGRACIPLARKDNCRTLPDGTKLPRIRLVKFVTPRATPTVNVVTRNTAFQGSGAWVFEWNRKTKREKEAYIMNMSDADMRIYMSNPYLIPPEPLASRSGGHRWASTEALRPCRMVSADDINPADYFRGTPDNGQTSGVI